VLFYPSGSTTATRVYGQLGSFTTGTQNNGGISANSLYSPTGIALDSSGNLYVPDGFNSRVLFYPSGSTTATRVYGQLGSFTTGTQNDGGISANSLDDSDCVALDSSGNLYVVDYGNNRVLMYPPTTTPGIYVPINLSTLTSNSVTFWWAGYPGATAYWLDIGSTMGGNNYYSSGNLGNVYNTTVYTLPTNGTTIYVTLYSLIGSEWIGNPYTYTALNATSGLAVMTTPNPLSGTTVTFNWSADTNATAYWVDISAVAAGGNDLDSSGNLGNVLTETVYNMPANSTPIYVSLYSYVGGQWLNKPYTYVSGP
jgi:hypothetical protein